MGRNLARLAIATIIASGWAQDFKPYLPIWVVLLAMFCIGAAFFGATEDR